MARPEGLIHALADELRRREVPVRIQEESLPWLTVEGRHCWLPIELRPSYCDRGRFIVKSPVLRPGATIVDLSVDKQDGFPRYYFTVDACAVEVRCWLQARGQLRSEVEQ